jgi:hypothetical protein
MKRGTTKCWGQEEEKGRGVLQHMKQGMGGREEVTGERTPVVEASLLLLCPQVSSPQPLQLLPLLQPAALAPRAAPASESTAATWGSARPKSEGAARGWLGSRCIDITSMRWCICFRAHPIC